MLQRVVLCVCLLAGVAYARGVEISIFSGPFQGGNERSIPLGFRELEEGEAMSARVPKGLTAVFYEKPNGEGGHVHVDSTRSANDFISAGLPTSPRAVLVEVDEGALLRKDEGINWQPFPVGVHELRAHPKFQFGAVTILLSDLVQATLFEGPGCGGRSRVIAGGPHKLSELLIDLAEEDQGGKTFEGNLACMQIEKRYGMAIYTNKFFQGTPVFVGPGSFGDVVKFIATGERIASARVQDHVEALLYANRYYVDHYVFLDGSVPDMSSTGLPDARSLKVTVKCLRPCVNGDCNVAPDFCKCSRGWFGDACDEFECDPPCEHGKCSIESQACICDHGWSGRACTSAHCPLGCAKGTCVAPNRCQCTLGFTGSRCDRPTSIHCGNGVCQSDIGESCFNCPTDCGDCPAVPSSRRGRGAQTNERGGGAKNEEERRRLIEEAAKITEEDLAVILIIGGMFIIGFLGLGTCGIHMLTLKAQRDAANRNKRD